MILTSIVLLTTSCYQLYYHGILCSLLLTYVLVLTILERHLVYMVFIVNTDVVFIVIQPPLINDL